MAKTTVPISAATVEGVLAQARRAMSAGAEMLELRTDYLAGLTLDRAAAAIGGVRALRSPAIPMIVTCRDGREGGVHGYPGALRTAVLQQAVRLGAAFIDLEFENFHEDETKEAILSALAESSYTRLILSAHSFDGPFEDLAALCADVHIACPTAVPKLVYQANHINECFAAFDLLHEEDEDIIVLCMGEAGLISRILANKVGSLVTFVSLDADSATASGQLTIGQYRDLYRADSLGENTELFGVIADPVTHSLSPAIHNGCFGDLEMDRLYLPLWVAGGSNELATFLNNVQSRDWLRFRGFSVTIPHKQHCLDHTRKARGVIEPLAEKIGAANTLIRSGDGRLHAYNTDYAGAMATIRSTLGVTESGLKGVRAALIGAGGVARAVTAGLVEAGALVTIYNRTASKAEALAREFDCRWEELSALTEVEAQLLINCTSLGMSPHVDAMPVPADVLKPGMVVFDTVYNPIETQLLARAKARGCKTIDGLSMFVGQAMAQFKLFTGCEGNAELMRSIVCDYL